MSWESAWATLQDYASKQTNETIAIKNMIQLSLKIQQRQVSRETGIHSSSEKIILADGAGFQLTAFLLLLFFLLECRAKAGTMVQWRKALVAKWRAWIHSLEPTSEARYSPSTPMMKWKARLRTAWKVKTSPRQGGRKNKLLKVSPSPPPLIILH